MTTYLFSSIHVHTDHSAPLRSTPAHTDFSFPVKPDPFLPSRPTCQFRSRPSSPHRLVISRRVVTRPHSPTLHVATPQPRRIPPRIDQSRLVTPAHSIRLFLSHRPLSTRLVWPTRHRPYPLDPSRQRISASSHLRLPNSRLLESLRHYTTIHVNSNQFNPHPTAQSLSTGHFQSTLPRSHPTSQV